MRIGGMQRADGWGVVWLALAWRSVAGAGETALDRYVREPDPSYAWKVVRTVDEGSLTTFVVELTSQTWRNSEEVDRPAWTHWLIASKPKTVRSAKAFLYIGGGRNGDPPPERAPAMVSGMAEATGSVVAELRTVPNQPLTFSDSPEAQRYEDDLVAYSRVKYFETKDPTRLVRLAMVKSAVRAMDALTELFASEAGGGVRLDGFVVAGGSKRGWTTWLVGAVDERVVAIVPIVIDALNSERITRHHYEAYGFFSPALRDYVRHGLFPKKVGTPEYREILEIEDAYHYRDRERLRIPKYLVNATGDEFFLPDNWRFYYNAMPPEKHLRYVPNAKHNLEGTDARESILAFYQMILENRSRPKYSWERGEDGSLRVVAADMPMEASLWQATNPDARDFRVDVIGKAWTKTPLAPESEGIYAAGLAPPEKGFTAFFIELVYDVGAAAPWKATTGVSVVPDVLPFRFEDALKNLE